jgi:nucleoside-diphosphate-sugar epimerase
MTDAIVEGAVSAGAKLVFADNLYVSGSNSPQPMTEDAPQRATDVKGLVRRLLAEKLLSAHHAGRVRVSIGRSSDYYGPGGTASATGGETFFGPALAGKTARWPGSLEAPHQLNYLPDIARALVTLGEREEADGEVFHLPAAEPITGGRFAEMVFAEIGKPPKVAAIPKTVMRLVGFFVPPARELPDIWYQYDQSFFADASKFRRVFGPFEPTPHEEAIARTVAWFREREDATR